MYHFPLIWRWYRLGSSSMDIWTTHLVALLCPGPYRTRVLSIWDICPARFNVSSHTPGLKGLQRRLRTILSQAHASDRHPRTPGICSRTGTTNSPSGVGSSEELHPLTVRCRVLSIDAHLHRLNRPARRWPLQKQRYAVGFCGLGRPYLEPKCLEAVLGAGMSARSSYMVLYDTADTQSGLLSCGGVHVVRSCTVPNPCQGGTSPPCEAA